LHAGIVAKPAAGVQTFRAPRGGAKNCCKKTAFLFYILPDILFRFRAIGFLREVFYIQNIRLRI